MRLAVGGSYEIINRGVPQGTPGNPPRLTVNEITEHEGAYIVTGEIHSFQTHPYIHGFISIPARSAVFVVLPVEYKILIEELVKLLKGQPLFLRSVLGVGKPQPIVNWAERLGSLWYTLPGQQVSVTEKQRRGKMVIDLWHEIRATEQVPAWFLEGRRAQKLPETMPDKPMPKLYLGA